MSSNYKIKIAKYGYIIISLITCFIGLKLLVENPIYINKVFYKFIGILLISFGIIKIIGYLAKDLYCLAFQHDLAIGILLIALGMVLFIKTNLIYQIIFLFWGILTMADAMLKIQTSIDSKIFGIKFWYLLLIISIITGFISFLLIYTSYVNLKLVIPLLGLSMLLEGILNLVTVFTVIK